MAPMALKKLIALQLARETELDGIRTRLKSKAPDSVNKHMVQSRLAALGDLWAELRKTNMEIIVRDDAETEPYVEQDWFQRIQSVYENALDECLTLLTLLEQATASTLPIASNDASFSEIRESGVAKLPRIPLPTFSGKYEDWASFCDLFTTLVHDVPRLSDATKLQYLKSCLKGSAADLIKDVATTSANYASTWKALKARYYNPRLIINKLLTAFMEIPHLRKESASELRSFVDEAQRVVRSLANLKLPVDHWDVWLVFILAERLDPESRKLWEAELSQRDSEVVSGDSSAEADFSNSLPKFSELVRFLEKRTQALGMVASERRGEKRPAAAYSEKFQSRKVFHASTGRPSKTDPSKCPLCSGPHPLMKCHQLRDKVPYERYATVKRLQACFNCLGQHRVSACPSSGRCSFCQHKHHTLLHVKERRVAQPPRRNINEPNDSQTVESAVSTPVVSLHASRLPSARRKVLLATARVLLMGPGGNATYVRALLDQGSESSFVTQSIVQLLGLEKQRTNVELKGLGANTACTARSRTRLFLRSSIDPDFRLETEALVLPKLTSQLPADSIWDINLQQFEGLSLADPEFTVANKVDLILGADVYGQLLCSGLRRFPPSQLVAQNTALGWIVSGSFQSAASRRAEVPASPSPMQILHCASCDVDQSLQQFWKLEDIPSSTRNLKPDDERCEGVFRDTHNRDSRGRYEVRLPLKAGLPSAAAETRRMARGSLSSLHRRLARDHRLAEAYRSFMQEYERLGHMTRIPTSEIERDNAWYLPHHAVVQISSSSWKLRVVFDASRQTREGISLNDLLLTGPPLQGDLSLILLNWRRYPFAFTADIVKMFRQIRVKPEDQDFQRIVWAASADSDPVDYRLSTVTYGTACAPFLAIRTLLQLVQDEGVGFPLGAECLKSETYVDDIFAGADDLSTAIKKRVELKSLLDSADIRLDKWAANHPDLLPPQVERGSTKSIETDSSVKTLGVQWNPLQDQFRFQAEDIDELSAATTKRGLLSAVSRLFDPLGWIAPVTVVAKILIQDLWILKCDWDSPLPSEFRERWYKYCQSLSALTSLSVDRWLGVTATRSYQLHGFSDASTRAYAAAIYLRVEEGDGRVHVSLLSAKSKIAPVKTVSIPNLELCGAALLVTLTGHVRKLEFLSTLPVFAWSDSQIVLMWLRKHPCHWKTFVANRVSYIQTELPSATWSHVPTGENPSDLATRGSEPADLARSDLWWHGPQWLSQPPEQWPQQVEKRQSLHAKARPVESELLTRFSSLTRLTRVVALCRRPLLNLRRRKQGRDPLPCFLTSLELTEARLAVIRLAQASEFSEEIAILNAGKSLPKRNRLGKLNPFLCDSGILRVGGRLSHSNLTFNRKHPPILSQHSSLSALFVRHTHHLCLHGGPTLTSSLLMQHVWILGRNRLVKTTIRSCITCQRVKPQTAQQLMGDLPADRVSPGRPFAIAGLDYAGPIQVRATKGRGYKAYKGYIVVLVCFVTRAIHLELVSDLTTASFICAYRRFVGRRGLCKRLYSDNATNFRGADTELQAMFHRASEFYHQVASVLANDGTEWVFIPPSAPHYGGLWEAGVKSVKHHLKRAVGEHTLTFEELSTVLVEIEACLNSRPLSALKTDVDDLQALTPFHFLNGTTSGLIPEDDLPDMPQNRLSRFQLLQRLRNLFWKRWSSEYLLHLQEREKWREPGENFSIGRLVLIKDDHYPPSKWPLGRITAVHPGPDGLVRVATVKTATTSLRRHIARLCPLHLDDGLQTD